MAAPVARKDILRRNSESMSKKERKRIDVSGDAEPLTDNPFASLADKLPKDLPRKDAQQQQNAPGAETPPARRPYRIERTRKGGYDLAFERRAKGKGVTVLRRVQGDSEALLKQLKKKCGAGGAVQEGCIELQGDHRAAIDDFLRTEGL